jgi:hypothetical protein
MSWKRLIAVFFLAVVIIGGLAAIILALNPGPELSVPGISKEDQKQILREVRKAMWRDAFPRFSWDVVRKSPRSIWQWLSVRMRKIKVHESDVIINGAVSSIAEIEVSHCPIRMWVGFRRNGAWEVKNRSRDVNSMFVRLPTHSVPLLHSTGREPNVVFFEGSNGIFSADRAASFSLSNDAKLSIGGKRD